jgi:hypothetical protein
VRLACVRHAASVRPEPGSNSPREFNSAHVERSGFLSVRPNHIVCRDKPIPGRPLGRPDQRVRTVTPIAHVDCQRAATNFPAGDIRRQPLILNRSSSHRQGAGQLPRPVSTHPKSPLPDLPGGVYGDSAGGGAYPRQAVSARGRFERDLGCFGCGHAGRKLLGATSSPTPTSVHPYSLHPYLRTSLHPSIPTSLNPSMASLCPL